MKILIAGITWPPETFLERLITGLGSKGFEITIASSDKPEVSWQKNKQLKWLHTPSWNIPLLNRMYHLIKTLFLKSIFHFKDLLHFLPIIKPQSDKESFLKQLYFNLPFCGKHWDLIYFPWNSAAITYLPLFDLNIPVVISCRGAQVNIAPHNPERFAIRDGLMQTFSKSTTIHCVSQAIRKEALLYGLDKEKSVIITPAVDTSFFSPGPKTVFQEDTYRAITIGSLIWRKGYEYALKAIQILKEEGIPIQFDIIGQGRDQKRIMYTIYDLNLQDNVHLHGKICPNKIPAYLRNADVFLLSSLSEGISNAVLEAMACALPVVTTNCGGMEEAVKHNTEGLIVPFRDPLAMATAIKIIRNQPERAKALGYAARKKVLSHFNLGNQVEQFTKLFSSIAYNHHV